MINWNDKEVIAIYHKRKVITALYIGTKLVWQAIRSCFGAGYWQNSKPWSNTEGWKN